MPPATPDLDQGRPGAGRAARTSRDRASDAFNGHAPTLPTGAGPAPLPPRPRESVRALVGRGLTVWRRSIQARVVVTVLLLSAIVVGVVGWVLLRQITDGLRRPAGSTRRSPRPRARPRWRPAGSSQAGSRDSDAGTQLSQLLREPRRARQGPRLRRGPGRAGRPAPHADSTPAPGTTSSPGIDVEQRPGARCARGGGAARHRLDLHQDPLPAGRGRGRRAGRGGRQPDRAARRRRRPTRST